MWELNYKESLVLKNWCFWTVVSEKTLENLLDWKVIKPINLKGNVLNITGRSDAEDEAPIFGHVMRRTDSLEKILILGKIEGRRRRGEQRMRWLEGSPTGWTWIWVSSRIWWWTGRPGLLQSLGWERVGHDWVTEQKQHEFLYEVKFSVLKDPRNWSSERKY